MQLALDPSRGDVDARPITGPGAPCDWCREPIPATSSTGRRTRPDAKHCGKRCRQASWRFGHPTVAPRRRDTTPLRFAYADPPYPGCARYYRDHPDYGGEVDHAELIGRLVREFPDGWALSTSSRSLRDVLALLPPEIDPRIGAWTKPRARPLDGTPARAWEPVIFAGGRAIADGVLVRDHVHAAEPRTLPNQVIGAKPGEFAFWLFAMLGAGADDELVDLFPGSGAISIAWARYVAASRSDTAVAV